MPLIDPETLHAEWHRAAALRSALASLAAAYQICLGNPPLYNTVRCELAKLGTRISSPRMWEQAVRETKLGNPSGDHEKDVRRCVEVARKQLREAGDGGGGEVPRGGLGEGERRGAWVEVKW
ncbi:hypothetical protein LTR95_013690 [Oleoguttula sp. CCFEE 5521]